MISMSDKEDAWIHKYEIALEKVKWGKEEWQRQREEEVEEAKRAHREAEAEKAWRDAEPEEVQRLVEVSELIL